MTDQKWVDRVTEVLSEEMTQPKVWHYFSFADEVFRGAVIVKAHGITDGLLEINRLGQNPHGEVVSFPIPDGMLPPDIYRNRLLTHKEIREFWPDAMTIREHEDKDAER